MPSLDIIKYRSRGAKGELLCGVSFSDIVIVSCGVMSMELKALKDEGFLEERDKIAQEMAGGESVWWMTPGWLKFRRQVFKGMDKAQANENFPRHTGGAIVLDPIGYTERFMTEKPEEFLDYSDWMAIPIQYCKVDFTRFKNLLAEAPRDLQEH